MSSVIGIMDSVEAIRTIEPGLFARTAVRLYAEFDGVISHARVESILRRALDDLAGSPAGAMPELAERLARQRLLDDSLSAASE